MKLKKIMAAVVTGMMAVSLMACGSSAPSGNAGSSASKGKDDKKPARREGRPGGDRRRDGDAPARRRTARKTEAKTESAGE